MRTTLFLAKPLTPPPPALPFSFAVHLSHDLTPPQCPRPDQMLKEGGLSSAQITAATNQAYVHRGVGLKELAQLDSGTEWLLAHAHTHKHTFEVKIKTYREACSVSSQKSTHIHKCETSKQHNKVNLKADVR